MRKFFSSCGAAASKACMTAVALAASVFMAQAADPVPITEVNQVLQEGTTYSYGQYKSISAQYTPTVNGVLRIDGFKGFPIYTSCTTPGSVYGDPREDYTADGIGQVRELTVTAGKTLYFYSGFTMDAGTVTLYLENAAPLELSYMQPNVGELVDFNNYPAMTLTFNQKTTVSDNNAYITFENRLSGSTQVLTSRISGVGTEALIVPFYNALKPFISSGAIKPGDEFNVMLQGLKSTGGEPYVNADANGNATFTFLCGSIPTICTNKYVPEPFLSYWPAGTPEGILTLTFDRPLGTSDQTVCLLGWGNQEGEDGEYYHEQLPVKIDGNKASVDFTGKLRTPATMTPMYPDSSYPTISIDIKNIVDEFGVPVGSEGSGTIGSYSFAPAYKVLERNVIAGEFEPAPGSDLADATEVNVYLTGMKGVTFDGFKIEATDKNTDAITVYNIPLVNVTVTPDGDDAAEYVFAMPQAVIDNAKSAVITLDNVKSLDGYDHSGDIRATYGGFVITYSDPANGTKLTTLDAGAVISIETNLSEKYPDMYVTYEIIDAEDLSTVKSSSWMTRQPDGSYQAEVFGSYKFLYGKEYRIVFTAWENEMLFNYGMESLGSDYVTIEGLTPPYIYSVVTLTEMTPEADTLLAADCPYISLTFDGVVRLNRVGILLGSGAGLENFKAVTPVEPVDVDGTIYASTWHLEFADGYLAARTTPLDVSFQAFDEEGRAVMGNEGEEANSYFSYSFDSPGAYKDLEISLGEEPLYSVSEIKVSYPIGVNISYEYMLSEVKVLDNMGVEVACMANYEMDSDPSDPYATSTSGSIILDKAVSTPGLYTLYIPRGFFNLGTEFDTAKNAEVNLAFEIMSAPYSVNPAEGVVDALETIVITYEGGDVTLAEDTGLRAEFWSDHEEGRYSFRYTEVSGNALQLTFNGKITDAGNYYVEIPAGLVKFADGSDAPAINLAYEIRKVSGGANVTVIPAPGVVTEIPQTLVIFFDDYTEVGPGSGIATLTFNDSTTTLPDSDFDWEDGENLNKMLQGTGAMPTYTDAGTYVFTFPAGYFTDGNGDPIDGFTLTYTIGSDISAVEAIDMDAATYTVYTAAGVRVLDRADREAFKALAPGLYIVNGVKIIKK